MSDPLCDQCTLQEPMVQGSGYKDGPYIAFVGEAPGYYEVVNKTPFVGMAGKVLRRVIDYAGIPTDRVYFTNLCMCRPPENRDPSAEEIRCCWPRLESELLEINPRMIVTLGVIPSRVLFPGSTLGSHRGRMLQSCLDIPGTITYHPAAMLYPKGASLFPYLQRDIERVWLRITGRAASSELSNPETKVVNISSKEDMNYLLSRLGALPDRTMIAFDWETTGTKPSRDVGFCMSLSWAVGTAVVLPESYIRAYRDQLATALSRHSLAGFNAALFDSKFNSKLGLPSNVADDAMLMHYALDERPQQRSLENLTIEELNAPAYETEMLSECGCSKAEMIEKVPAATIYEYCGKDADWSLRLNKLFEKRLRDHPQLHLMYKSLLIPGALAFAKIQERGVWVDRVKLQEVSQDYLTESEHCEHDLILITGEDNFNPRSHKQVQTYIWDTIKLDQPEIYGRADRSADAATLKVLIENYPDEEFLTVLRNYRTAYTLYSRYLRDMDDYIDSDGRVRTQYHLDRTETGRLSTTNPAIHQTPREGKVRTIFGAPPGFKLIQADYSQVEMRMAAHCAGDDELAYLFQELEEMGADFHTFMASKAFNVALNDVTKDQRQSAKTVSFGILYRMSPKGLAARLGVTVPEAVKIIKDYEALMPGVSKWIRKTEAQVKGQGFVETIFGRRRRFPFITQQNISELLREAVNTPIQSASSDLTLTKVIELHGIFERYFPEAGIVLMVHDEIDVECPTPLVPQVAKIIKKTMETPPFETNIPFPVEIVVGDHWGEGEELAI